VTVVKKAMLHWTEDGLDGLVGLSYFDLHRLRNFNEGPGAARQPGNKYAPLSNVLFG